LSAPTSDSTQWSVPVNTGPLKQDYTIQIVVTDNLGCKDTAFQVKSVYPKPIAGFTAASYQGCTPFTLAQLQNTSNAQNGEPATSLTYSWNWGIDSSSIAVPSIILPNTGVVDSLYNLTLRIVSQHGCADTLTKVITVHPNAKANLIVNSPLECAPFYIDTLHIQAVRYPQANSIYTWYAKGTQIGTGINFPGYTISQPADSALIELRVTSLNNCFSDTAKVWFRTIPNPKPNFEFQDSVGCTPFQITTNNLTPDAQQMSFIWKFSDGSPNINAVTAQPVFTNLDSLDRNIKVRLIAIAGTGCRDSVEKSFNVKPLPRPRFSFSDTSVCFPLLANLTNQSGHFPAYDTT
jgi:hypothetical protein